MAQPPVNTQPKERRAGNFDEVSLGYSKKQAVDEARRCLQCAVPVCSFACPLGIDIPGFIRHIRENETDRALAKIKQNSFFASICGRLCPAPCEKACVLEPEGAPIGVRALERYASDHGKDKFPSRAEGRGKKIAIVGSGPAGISAAMELANKGFQVTIFESMPLAGGVLRYGVPEFRLPSPILEEPLKALKSLGVDLQTGVVAGRTLKLSQIRSQGFAAIFLAMGAGAPRWADIPGNNLGGVCYAEEFLMRVNLYKANHYPKYQTAPTIGRRVVVIGDGHAALDCARILIRLGREATVVFSRTEEDMPVRFEEKDYGKEEGVHLEALARPLAILSNDKNFVAGVKCIRMDFADPDSSGKWVLVPVSDSEFVIEADSVILAQGNRPPDLLRKMAPELKFNNDGTLLVDDELMTPLRGVFAAGVVAGGRPSVVEALAAGKKAAQSIENFLNAHQPINKGAEG